MSKVGESWGTGNDLEHTSNNFLSIVYSNKMLWEKYKEKKKVFLAYRAGWDMMKIDYR